MLDPTAVEWVHLVLRWAHVIAAIAWIGHAFLFNEIEHALVKPDGDAAEGDDGDMWMVHGGGFFYVRKTRRWPTAMRGSLKWFMWEAFTTWASGFLLLMVVYYMGGMLLDSGSTLPTWAAWCVGLGALVVAWIVYDLLCRSPLGNNNLALGVVGFVLMVGAAFGLSQVLSGRAAYIHIGAMIGTMMTANVWLIIIPAMRKMVAAVDKDGGGLLDATLGMRAKQRSFHNNYFVYPLLFIMISSHYPGTYAHGWNWLILAGIALLGASIKHVMNITREVNGVYLAIGAIVFGFATFTILGLLPRDTAATPDLAAGERVAVDPSTTGVIRGVVRFEGSLPPPAEISLFGGCEQGHDGPVLDDSAIVTDGRVANAFVWLADGADGFEVPVPQQPVVVDQLGCIYDPHVAGVQTGQELVFVNSDAIAHNVRTVTSANETFNEVMPNQGQRLSKRFLRPEVMLQARCDLHPWMSAWIGVVPHPWFAVTDTAGGFSLQGVPPGTYEIGVWHEKLGTRRTQVEVAPLGWAEVDVVLAP